MSLKIKILYHNFILAIQTTQWLIENEEKWGGKIAHAGRPFNLFLGSCQRSNP